MISKIYESPLRSPFFAQQIHTDFIIKWHEGFITQKSHMRSPEKDMLLYYYLNNSIAKLENIHGRYASLYLYDEIINDYLKEGFIIGGSIFVYLLFICLRESRHAYLSSEQYTAWEKKYPHIGTLIKSINNSGAVQSIHASVQTLSKMEPFSVYELMCGLTALFTSGCFGASCGGPLWAAISNVMCLYLHGDITLEALIDQAFNLQHNTSNVFNKGFIFKPATHAFDVFLEIQKHGVIPESLKYMKDYYDKYHLLSIYNKLLYYESIFPTTTQSFTDLIKSLPSSFKNIMYPEGYIAVNFPVVGLLEPSARK